MEFLWIWAKTEITQKRIGGFHMIFLRIFFFFFTCRRDVTPRAFRNDASNSKVSGTIPMASCLMITRAVMYGLRVCKGGSWKVFEQSNKLRFGVTLFFTVWFFICHVSGIRIKTRENGRILDWRGARPNETRLPYSMRTN